MKTSLRKDALFLGVFSVLRLDTGIGIPAAGLPFIWEWFYKVDKAHTRAKSGTGLGLAIGKEIIEMHDATVEVTSSPEQGTD